VKRGTTRPEAAPRPDDAIGSEVMTLQEVAGYLNCHYTTVYRLIRRGGFPTFRVGSDFRMRRADLEKWIAQQQQQVVVESEVPETPELEVPELEVPKAPTKRKIARKPKVRS
jgi:excisionase family DNA binding protein